MPNGCQVWISKRTKEMIRLAAEDGDQKKATVVKIAMVALLKDRSLDIPEDIPDDEPSHDQTSDNPER